MTSLGMEALSRKEKKKKKENLETEKPRDGTMFLG